MMHDGLNIMIRLGIGIYDIMWFIKNFRCL